jgi:hypothetical protein
VPEPFEWDEVELQQGTIPNGAGLLFPAAISHVFSLLLPNLACLQSRFSIIHRMLHKNIPRRLLHNGFA